MRGLDCGIRVVEVGLAPLTLALSPGGEGIGCPPHPVPLPRGRGNKAVGAQASGRQTPVPPSPQ